MAERNPKDTLRALESEAADSERALDDAVSRVTAMSREQRELELEEAGFDLDDVYGAADAFYERMLSAGEHPAAGEPVPVSDFAPSSGALPSSDEGASSEEEATDGRVVSLARARKVRRWTWALAAGFALVGTAVATVGGDAVVARFKVPQLGPSLPGGEVADHLPPAPVRRPPPLTRAELGDDERDHAQTLCDRAFWDNCRQALDRARELDPAGEAEERVKEMRVLINERPWEMSPKKGFVRRGQ